MPVDSVLEKAGSENRGVSENYTLVEALRFVDESASGEQANENRWTVGTIFKDSDEPLHATERRNPSQKKEDSVKR